MSNAEVERGFSAVNRIKTDLRIRNRLSTGKLEVLMMIHLMVQSVINGTLKHPILPLLGNS
jgi:hypothetical protein